jgi:hypothetical protein
VALTQALNDLERLMANEDSAFVCTAAGDRSGKKSFVARLRHEGGPPASRAALAELRRLAGSRADEARPLYERHDGLRLYADTRSATAGIALFPIEEWAARTEALRQDWSHVSAAEDPEQLLSGVAIGEPPQSGNAFVWLQEGPRTGQVFYLEHDDWPQGPFAEDFAAFLAKVLRDPVELLDSLGAYARYRDGRTDTQWIPSQFLDHAPEARKPAGAVTRERGR